MTMLLGFTVPDGVVLICDGRVFDQKNGFVLNDDEDKLAELRTNVFVGRSGYAKASENVVSVLRHTAHKHASHDALIDEACSVARMEWKNANECAPQDIPRKDLQIGLLIGGTIGCSSPFLSAIGCSAEGPVRSTVIDYIRCLMVAGESDVAKWIVYNGSLRQRVGEIIAANPFDKNSGPRNATIDGLLSAAATAIRDVSREDQTVGGTIRFAVVRSSYSIVRGTL